MYPYLHIFGQSVSMYTLSAIVGLLFTVGFALLRRRAPYFRTDTENLIFVIMVATIGALLGAKVFQLTGIIIRDGSDPGFWTLAHWKILIRGVGVFYGGLIGGIAAALIYIRKYKLDLSDVSDILVPCVLLFCTFGRIGCFLAGCCYGREASWGLVPLHGSEPLIPVQLFEAIFTFVVMVAILVIRPERKWPGFLLPLYILVYAVGRFVLEFFRGDMQRGVYVLSTSQWISLLLLPAGIYLMVRAVQGRPLWHRTKTDSSDAEPAV